MSWKPTEKLLGNIGHYASFPPTGVSLRQMVQFGEKPGVGKMSRSLGLKLFNMVQGHCFEHPSSSPKSCQFAWLTE